MSIREIQYRVLDLIRPDNVLVSVFDKNGLQELIKGLLEVNPDVRFYSTGGTGKKIVEILGESASKNYMSVEDFTGAPEMEGGLVKTLHPKIHAGLLAERGNPAHESYLYETLSQMGKGKGVYFDVLVGNLYPFMQTIAKEDATSETARVNIDIGGPTMIMASAKNWHSVAALTSPDQYPDFIKSLKENSGRISLKQRFALAQSAMRTIGEYRTAIANYFNSLEYDKDVKSILNISI